MTTSALSFVTPSHLYFLYVCCPSDEWKLIADMHSKRSAMVVVALRGKIYAIGGYDGENKLLDTVERYDPETNAWEMVAKLQRPRAR